MRRMFSDCANYKDEKKTKIKTDDKFCINTFENQDILKNRYDMPFGIQIIKNTKRLNFFSLSCMFLVQYALYRSNAHYNELVVHMKQTSASRFTLNTLLLFDNHTKYFSL